ncbi:MAG: signal peptidase I [Spirochaetota bacterium]|nr:signal peptidase I [Spirochaetota bacterium]
MYIPEENRGSVFIRLTKVIMLVTGLVLGLFIARIFIIPFTVLNESMSPNLKRGDIVYVLRHITPAVGDIILFNSPVEPDRVLLKRVIAKEGDTIEISRKKIYKNSQEFKSDWEVLSNDDRIFPMNFSYRDNMQAMRLKRNEFFVLGDNIDYSFDSRTFGAINKDAVIGKVIFKK